jgi:hypothetical protein
MQIHTELNINYSDLNCFIQVNAYIAYKGANFVTKKMGHLDFQLKICEGLLGTYREQRKRAGRPQVGDVPIRLQERHFPKWLPNQDRKQCVVCRAATERKRKVRSWCPDCGVGLCVGRCFEQHHTLFRLPEQPVEE